jgi:hypothetical protein
VADSARSQSEARSQPALGRSRLQTPSCSPSSSTGCSGPGNVLLGGRLPARVGARLGSTDTRQASTPSRRAASRKPAARGLPDSPRRRRRWARSPARSNLVYSRRRGILPVIPHSYPTKLRDGTHRRVTVCFTLEPQSCRVTCMADASATRSRATGLAYRHAGNG